MPEQPSTVIHRDDIISPTVSKQELASFKKATSPVRRQARNAAKPTRCRLCGKEVTHLCNSHSIPQFSLKEIAENGKLLTFNGFLGGNLSPSTVGVAKAGVFQAICEDCDTEFFKQYETPENLFQQPSNKIMGQIATKCLLERIAHGNYQIELDKALGQRPLDNIAAIASTRTFDKKENEAALRQAISAGKQANGHSFRLIFHEVLSYLAPFAFQQMITLISDFEGGLINNVYCFGRNLKTSPIFICVLPTQGKTIVNVFRNEQDNKYRTFERQIANLPNTDALLAIVKIIFAYSESAFMNIRIGHTLTAHTELQRLARMNSNYSGSTNDAKEYAKVTLEKARKDFAINNLPTPPALLSQEYAL